MKDTGLENLYIFVAEKMVRDYKNGSQQIHHELKTGITVDQWVVLKYVSENNGSDQASIARSSAKDAPNTTRIIDQLVKKKLVVRKADATDRRRFSVMITEKGKALVKKVVPHILKHRKNTIKGIGSTQLKETVDTLKKMITNLEKNKS